MIVDNHLEKDVLIFSSRSVKRHNLNPDFLPLQDRRLTYFSDSLLLLHLTGSCLLVVHLLLLSVLVL